ncbi:MAG: MBL fold metallo-hydrolase [Candidatus Aenigmatarchaeota archaeon]
MTIIEITILGTTAAVPTKKRNHPAIYLRYVGRKEQCVLFDCGEGTQRQILLSNLNFMRIDHIFITHWHADHFAGLLGIFETMSLEKRKKPLFVYGPEAEKHIKILSSAGHGHKGFEIVAKDIPLTKDYKVYEDDEFFIISTPVYHGIPSVAYAFVEKDRVKVDKNKAMAMGLPEKGKIYDKLKKEGFLDYKGKKIHIDDISYIERGKKVVYSGDTKICKNLIDILQEADLAILDCTYFNNGKLKEKIEGRFHMSLSDIIKILDVTRARIVLTHISRRYQNYKELENIINEKIKDNIQYRDRIIIARDLLKITI